MLQLGLKAAMALSPGARMVMDAFDLRARQIALSRPGEGETRETTGQARHRRIQEMKVAMVLYPGKMMLTDVLGLKEHKGALGPLVGCWWVKGGKHLTGVPYAVL